MNEKSIGIDVGGSKIEIAVVDGNGKILAGRKIATQAKDPFDETLPRMLDAINGTASEAGIDVEESIGIGVGCSGPLDIKKGLVLNPYTLPGWDGINLIAVLKDATGCPAWLENDADSALLGEAFAGSGRGCTDLVMLTLGTGVGGAAISQGQLYRGSNSEHPEIGHMPVMFDGPDCYCGAKGCLEALASGGGIASQGEAIGLKDTREVFEQAGNGHPAAQEIIDRALLALKMATWTILHTFLPQRIILGGGIIEKHPELFLDPLPEIIRQSTMVTQTQVDVVLAELGNKAGVIGAASLPFRG